MRIIDSQNPIHVDELQEMAVAMFGNMVKAVVDIERDIMAVDAELHADEEALLIEKGSNLNSLWGINLYPELEGNDFVEFNSMINLRPSQGNSSRGVENPIIQDRIRNIVNRLVIR